MLTRWIAGVGKLVAIIVGLGTIGGAIVGGILWAGTRASATEMETRFGVVERRQDVAEAKAEDDREWRRWMVGQVTAISRRVGAAVAPPPVITAPADDKAVAP